MVTVTRKTKKLEKDTYSLVCDMNNIMKIASVNHDMNSEGKEYGMVATTLRMIGDVLKKKDFDYCVAAYDGYGSGFLRYKMYKDYKANRGKSYALFDPEVTDYEKKMILAQMKILEYSKKKKKENNPKYIEDEDESFERQREIIWAILENLCIRQYRYNYVEGDDVISNYIKNKPSNEKCVIISSDKDLTQLISDTVIIWNPRIKSFITKDNSKEVLGIPHTNIVLEKILCGDSSDNIKGVKGVGEQTLKKYIPQIMTDRLDLEAVVSISQGLLDSRKAEKKKPLQALQNIVSGVTDGCQGDKLYEINKKLIDLSEPLMTEEALKEFNDEVYAPLDLSDRNMKNIYEIVRKNNMSVLCEEGKFGNLFSPFSRIIMMEKKRSEDNG